jgi:hypothetical protein
MLKLGQCYRCLYHFIQRRISKRLRPQGPKTPEFVRKDEGSVRIKKEQSFAGNCVHWNHVAG